MDVLRPLSAFFSKRVLRLEGYHFFGQNKQNTRLVWACRCVYLPGHLRDDQFFYLEFSKLIYIFPRVTTCDTLGIASQPHAKGEAREFLLL